MQRAPLHRVWSCLYRARAALLAAERDDNGRYVRAAQREARMLARQRGPVQGAALAQVQGTLALLRGDAGQARSELERALTLYLGNGMRLHAEAIRFRLGALHGGDEGARWRSDARQTANALGVRNPERWFRCLAPGFRDQRA